MARRLQGKSPMTKKPTAAEFVSANLAKIQELAAAGDLDGLRITGRFMGGFASASGFSAYKRALLAAGVDYDAIREGRFEAKAAEAAAAAGETSVTFYTDAKARTDRYAVCDRQGAPVWFGKFFSDDRTYNGEQSSGELAAALKAVWLAAQVAKAAGKSAINLTLRVDAEWLTWANEVAAGGAGGGKARALGEQARRLGVLLTVEHIPGSKNPADAYTTCSGFRSYKDTDLASLIG
jgi:hypothetical protein